MKKLIRTIAISGLMLTASLTVSAYVLAPDNTIIETTSPTTVTPKPFNDCDTAMQAWRFYTLNASDINTLRLRATAITQRFKTANEVIWGFGHYYGGTYPQIVDNGATYSVTWAISYHNGSNWVPSGTFTLTVPK